MRKPTLHAIGTNYLLQWEAESIVATVTRIKESRDTVTAEVLFKTSLNQHIHQARLNLVSTAARKTLANFLNGRLPELDWEAGVEQLCLGVLEHHRLGDPVVTLGELPPQERLVYRVRPVLLEKQPNLLYGPGGVGKSMFAAYLATLITSPLNGPGLEVEPGNVLYLDFETSQEELDDRVRLIQTGLGIESPSNIKYRFCYQSLADDVDNLRQLVVEHEADMVVVDSIGAACGGEPESAEIVLRYFNALRSLRITTLSIDHTNKEGHLFGSVYKLNCCRSVWEAKKSQEVEDSAFKMGLYHRKMNNGRLNKPLGFEMAFQESLVNITRCDVRDVYDLAQGMHLREQISSVLRRGAMSLDEITEEVSGKHDSVKTTLSRNKTMFVKRGDLWSLLSKEQSP